MTFFGEGEGGAHAEGPSTKHLDVHGAARPAGLQSPRAKVHGPDRRRNDVDWVTLGAAFGLVFVAEFADKTQLVLLGLASRGKAWQVWLGAAAAFLVLTVLAAAAGDLIARLVPDWVVTVLAATLFLVFGVLALRGDDDDETASITKTGFLPTFGIILIAEMGDKTQLAIAALAASSGAPVATAIGGTAALWASAAVAVAAGGWLATKVRPDLLRRITGILFLVLAALLLVSLLLPVSII